MYNHPLSPRLWKKQRFRRCQVFSPLALSIKCISSSQPRALPFGSGLKVSRFSYTKKEAAQFVSFVELY
jgi:hypothetical protein